MRLLFYNARLLFLTLAVLLTGQSLIGPSAQAQEADALFERLQAKYESIDALRAQFTQTMTSPYADQEETFTGTLIFQQDRYRVETGSQTFVTDGRVTWIYMPVENQVLINDYVEDETAFSLNNFFLNYAENYDITGSDVVQHEGEKHYVLNLKPKSADTFFSDVTIWMRDRDNLVTKLKVTDMNETTMTFTLRDIELNPPLQRDTFSFTPPQGADVIDLRS